MVGKAPSSPVELVISQVAQMARVGAGEPLYISC